MATETLNLEIISPTESVKIEVQWIEVESPTGSFMIGPKHVPIVSTIKKKSSLEYKLTDGTIKRQPVSGGVFSVLNNRTYIVLDG